MPLEMHARRPHQQRNPHRFLVHMSFVDQAMLPKAKTVVTHINYHRVFRKSVFSQVIQHTANALVKGQQRFQVSPVKVLKNNGPMRSEEHTSELQSLMRISYTVFCLKK